MEYYLTITTCTIEVLGDEVKVTQLVMASSKENAKIAVEEEAELHEGVTVIDIRVHDTLIGK